MKIVLPPIALPPVETPRAATWTIEQNGLDKMLVHVPWHVLTRAEAFRLIGELERTASQI